MAKGRAYRRAQVARLKVYRRNYLCGLRNEREIGRAVWTPTLCSCWMCGNPRRHMGERTIQERRFMQERVEEE
ncbi:hypothetical protein AB4Z48_37250 [Cupriavidus sp. 2TAF22]|uniref:hypothetical protein n=1 Tax=unclassified Cupriavidus TaxID=2640874 RepID=UPI003F8E19E0